MAKANKKSKKVTVQPVKTAPKSRIPWWRHAVLLFLIVTVVFGVYANSLRGNFIWDDIHLIKDNTYVKNWGNLLENLTNDFFLVSQEEGKIGYYRPVITLSYMLDYSIWRLRPAGYHLTNILFHAANCLVVYLVVFFLSGNLFISFLTALLFAIHPIHTESVAWISGRTDIIASLFFFLSFFLYGYSFRKEKVIPYLLSVFTFCLALLSKEMTITLPLTLIIYDYYFVVNEELTQLKKRIRYWIPFWCFILIYVVWRFLIIRIGTGNPHVESLGRIPVVVTFGKAILYYLRKLIIPLNLNSYVMVSLGSFFNLKTWTGFILIALLIWTAIRIRKEYRAASFCIVFFLVTMLPLTNVMPISAPFDIDFPMAERFLYIPSFGFCLLLGLLGGELFSRVSLPAKATSICLLSLIFIPYGYNTVTRNRDWWDETKFYLKMTESSPDSFVIHNNLGVKYNEIGEYEKAIESCRRALKKRGDYVEAYNNIGVAYFHKGEYDQALRECEKALKVNPRYEKIYNNLGVIYYTLKKYDVAVRQYEEAIRLKPKLSDPYYNLGNLYYDLRKYDAAIWYFKKALALDPDAADAYNNLANVYITLGRFPEAIESAKKALEIKPDFAEAHNNLGSAYNNLKINLEEAVREFREALRLDPKFAVASFNLGIALNSLGRYEEARQAYEKAARINPDYTNPHVNLGVMYLERYGDRAKALYHFRRVLEIDPTNVQAEAIKKKVRELTG